MNKKEITFLSSRGRSLCQELSLVKTFLAERYRDEVQFRYYLNNELHQNPLAAHGYRRAKKSFCEGMTNAVCVDASLSTNLNNLSPEGSRILLAVPYDYQFKNMVLMEQKKKQFHLRTMARFTHLIAGSPFTAELLKKAYRLEDRELIEGVDLPLAWDAMQPGHRRRVQEEILFYYPQAAGKKILSIIVYGDEERKRKDWESFDIRAFTKKLGEDWFVFTNSEILMENAFAMSNHYKSCFGYMNRILPVPDLLYVSDVLVTNNGRLASAFSRQKKPVYACQYNKNYFEKYMSYAYPDMYFSSADKMAQHEFEADMLTEEQKRFCEKMSYSDGKEPYGVVAELLGFSQT